MNTLKCLLRLVVFTLYHILEPKNKFLNMFFETRLKISFTQLRHPITLDIIHKYALWIPQ